ncbi:ImmA/IrrE family metallo-endopeptidase [Lyngbya sp. PCC 8106]|uniref:ImmA/IrrE family metallo-endopeptidase n=1 Tax=Lyngbya sp. (strain PCC 8106) TaxID=313612 RepID=UPI0000EAC247|nr:ImmA/IrrE family metallo-endopeptidase [Lyngbya sp. PCC 8106]EAW34819.1 hypothetical protein L8106_18237 [Lyngbya sp. PCC 8106]
MGVTKSYRRLSKAEIEKEANHLLLKMQSTTNFPKWPDVAERAVNFLKLDIVWDKISISNGQCVAARIYPTERLIEINEDIPELKENPGFLESTIAHEVGHWILHVNHDEADGLSEQLELPWNIVENHQPFLCKNTTDKINKNYQKTQADWIEWQAQYFASCLLMPRYILEEKRKGRDLTQWSHLYAMRESLGVTISNLTNRLQDLDWIYIPNGSKQIYLNEKSQDGQRKLF